MCRVAEQGAEPVAQEGRIALTHEGRLPRRILLPSLLRISDRQHRLGVRVGHVADHSILQEPYGIRASINQHVSRGEMKRLDGCQVRLELHQVSPAVIAP